MDGGGKERRQKVGKMTISIDLIFAFMKRPRTSKAFHPAQYLEPWLQLSKTVEGIHKEGIGRVSHPSMPEGKGRIGPLTLSMNGVKTKTRILFIFQKSHYKSF